MDVKVMDYQKMLDWKEDTKKLTKGGETKKFDEFFGKPASVKS